MNMDIKGKIRNEVIKKLKQGITEFVIYPYGNYGQITKNTLAECFGIAPIYIVDNELANYNPHIISFDKFKKEYSASMSVLLTVENYKINMEMQNALSDFVVTDKIINLFGIEPEIKNQLCNREDVCVNELIASGKKGKVYRESEKIKLRIVCSGHCTWNSFIGVVELCLQDNAYDILIINSSRDFEVDTDFLKRKMLPYTRMADYHAEDDLPDVVIIINPFDRVTPIDYLRQYAKYIIALPVVIYNGFSHEKLTELITFFEKARPDYYLLDSFIYREAQTMPIAPRIVEMGNPKFDGIYKFLQKKEMPKNWEKLKNKKIVCWTTDHGIKNGMVNDCVSFDRYAKTIISYAKSNEELGFIFRPHKKLIEELMLEKYWNEDDLKKFEQYCDKSPNIIFDQNDSYDQAFSIADAILVDPFCGIVLSALPLMKPMCITYRDDGVYPHPYELLENYYSARTSQELLSFFEMVKQGDDPMYQQRKDVYVRNVMHFDGKNSLRVKEFIEKLIEGN